jgi:predicted ATP-binding protein involved in virulence
MRINTLRLHNFKKFSDVEFVFNHRFTVLIGNNAAGKTSILEALSALMGSYLLGSGINSGHTSIKKEDARTCVVESNGQVFVQPQENAYVEATGILHDTQVSWKRKVGDRGASAKSITDLAAVDRKKTSECIEINLPILLYYGFNRTWNV